MTCGGCLPLCLDGWDVLGSGSQRRPAESFRTGSHPANSGTLRNGGLHLTPDSAPGSESDAAAWAKLRDMHGGGGEIRCGIGPTNVDIVDAQRLPPSHSKLAQPPPRVSRPGALALGVRAGKNTRAQTPQRKDESVEGPDEPLTPKSGVSGASRASRVSSASAELQGRLMRTLSATATGARRSAIAARKAAVVVGKQLQAAPGTSTLCGSSPKAASGALCGSAKAPPAILPRPTNSHLQHSNLTDGASTASSNHTDGSAESSAAVAGVVFKQPEDGSCLFHSIAHGLQDGTAGEDLRKQVAEVIEDEPSLKIANTSVGEWVAMSTGKSPQAHAHELYRGDVWGGALELAVAAKVKGVNIHVYEQCPGGFHCITAFNEPTAKRTVNVVYQTEPCRHYDALSLEVK